MNLQKVPMTTGHSNKLFRKQNIPKAYQISMVIIPTEYVGIQKMQHFLVFHLYQIHAFSDFSVNGRETGTSDVGRGVAGRVYWCHD